jgi:hypothetical protein
MTHRAGEPEPGRDDELEAETGGEEVEEAPRNPFDNPYFLPVLLLGLSVWFGYDGWFNADEHMQKYKWFNQGGFLLLVALGVWFLVRARRERRAEVAPED